MIGTSTNPVADLHKNLQRLTGALRAIKTDYINLSSFIEEVYIHFQQPLYQTRTGFHQLRTAFNEACNRLQLLDGQFIILGTQLRDTYREYTQLVLEGRNVGRCLRVLDYLNKTQEEVLVIVPNVSERLVDIKSKWRF